MSEPTTPNAEDAERCFELRCRSKRGERLTDEEHTFLRGLWEKHPAWYGSLDARVFEETKPFGAQ